MAEQAPNTTQKRLRILGDDEIEALYGKPHFTDDERLEYFALSPMEQATLEQLHSIKSRIYFILPLLSREWVGPIANSAVGCTPWDRYAFSDTNESTTFH
jgi:hypothetical protein